jgi:hypothetical protein
MRSLVAALCRDDNLVRCHLERICEISMRSLVAALCWDDNLVTCHLERM